MRANQMLPLARLHQDVHVLIGALHPENFVAILKIFLVDLIAEKLIIGTTSSMPRKYFLDNRQRVSRAMQSRDVLIAPDVLVCAPRRKTARASGLWLPWRCGSSLRTLILSLAWMKFRSARITCLLSVLIITLFENLKRRIPSAAYFFEAAIIYHHFMDTVIFAIDRLVDRVFSAASNAFVAPIPVGKCVSFARRASSTSSFSFASAGSI